MYLMVTQTYAGTLTPKHQDHQRPAGHTPLRPNLTWLSLFMTIFPVFKPIFSPLATFDSTSYACHMKLHERRRLIPSTWINTIRVALKYLEVLFPDTNAPHLWIRPLSLVDQHLGPGGGPGSTIFHVNISLRFSLPCHSMAAKPSTEGFPTFGEVSWPAPANGSAVWQWGSQWEGREGLSIGWTLHALCNVRRSECCQLLWWRRWCFCI